MSEGISASSQPKRRYWRIFLGVALLFAKLIQFVTTGPTELLAGATPYYRVGGFIGDMVMFSMIYWLIYSGLKPKQRP